MKNKMTAFLLVTALSPVASAQVETYQDLSSLDQTFLVCGQQDSQGLSIDLGPQVNGVRTAAGSQFKGIRISPRLDFTRLVRYGGVATCGLTQNTLECKVQFEGERPLKIQASRKHWNQNPGGGVGVPSLSQQQNLEVDGKPGYCYIIDEKERATYEAKLDANDGNE